MTRNSTIIESAHWWQTPPGRYLLAWEQVLIDHLVTDVFGFHALQLGLPQLDGLRANRMPHRWLATPHALPEELLHVGLPPVDAALSTLQPGEAGCALLCDFEALPFPDHSLDLVLMPHTLEFARDPHDTLREVERVLVPEGRIVLLGLNPASLWGLRQGAGRLRQRLGGPGSAFLPRSGELIGYRRSRDWLRLLGLEVSRARFGCWRPPLQGQRWLDRWAWIESAGEHAWPVFGAVYALEAVKRVRGMRLVGLARRAPARAPASSVAVAPRSGLPMSCVAAPGALAAPIRTDHRPDWLDRLAAARGLPSASRPAQADLDVPAAAAAARPDPASPSPTLPGECPAPNPPQSQETPA